VLPWLATPPMPATAPVAVGEYVVQPRERRLLDTRGQAVPIGGRAFELLLALIERAGQVVSLDELKELAWPGIVIEQNTLRVHMASLRKALRDNQKEARYIATIPGRGYSLICGAGTLVPHDEGTPRGQVPVSWHRMKRTLPSNHDPVVGRDDELAALVGTVQRHRVTTLVAGGGMGKSTLARELALRVMQAFDDEVHFIDLADGPDAAVAEALPALAGLAGLAGKRSLLVLDNCDKALDAVASSVLQWAAHGDLVHVLATSREPLGLPHEQLHWLRPLEISDIGSLRHEGTPALHGPAVALLADRIRAHDGGRFRLTQDNMADAIALCRRVEGLPLAIELMAQNAARLGLRSTKSLSAEELLALPHPRRTAPKRHASLEALCRSSLELLGDVDLAVLRRCSRLGESFTFDAARQSLASLEGASTSMPGHLIGLLEKSHIEPALDVGPGHFRVPALMRSFFAAEAERQGA
jgi:DNA-binding winged helix-turn-helix (wHTH) protein/predicted ATPase